jgi:Taurine catabolism dioxygenase TauD, TfdA family
MRVMNVTAHEHENQRLATICRQLMTVLASKTEVDRDRVITQVVNSNLQSDAPTIAGELSRARGGEIDALYIKGLPTDPAIAPILILALTYALGMPFNYATQNAGALVMSIRPDRISKKANTNSTAEELGYHSDDAAVARAYRVAWISLFGLVNPPGTVTSYVPIAPVVERLSPFKAALFDKRFRVRVPLSFNLGDDVWSAPTAILSNGEDGALEIAWSSFATRVVDEKDTEAKAALDELAAGLDAFAVRVPIDPGCFLTFNNLRGVHMRSKIGNDDRLVLRTYARDSLSELRAVTGADGPIFDTRAVVAATLA